SAEIRQRLKSSECRTVPLVVRGQSRVISKNPEPVAIETPTMVTVGRYDIHTKGLDVLIRAIRELNLEGFEIRLKCVGYDRDGGVANLEKFVAGEDATQFVECCGPKYGEEKLAIVNSAQIYCLPSRYESFSYSLMEGLGSGLAVLVGKGACVTSYLSEEMCQVLLVSPKTESWKLAIKDTLDNRSKNQEISRNANSLFLEIGSPESIGRQLSGIYDEAKFNA
ncbi:glycosyltransferase, partial [Akkermansiaceae bacterium]|nr:glycosyltransferase [Akkermansiaceae bacterium]